MSRDSNSEMKLRVDKWLWAARFFKTRTLAKTAIEGGKVQVNGQRVKVSKEITLGDRLSIRQGWDERDVEVLRLLDRRGPAQVAQRMYQELPESIQRREHEAALRRAAGGLNRPQGRPDKHERRQLNRLRRGGEQTPFED